MTRVVFSDHRNPAAEQAYEIAWDFLARAGAIRDESEACAFLARRIGVMVDQGHTAASGWPTAPSANISTTSMNATISSDAPG